MKELISIYVSLFLVFSPAFAQSKFSVGTPTEDVKEWTLTMSNGTIHSNVQLRELRGDNLDVIEMGIPRTINIKSIDKISATKGKRKTGNGAKIGLLGGAMFGAIAGRGGIGDSCYDSGCRNSSSLFGGLVVGVFGFIVGAVIGSFFKYVEEYDMSDWSIDEKRTLIQKMMKK